MNAVAAIVGLVVVSAAIIAVLADWGPGAPRVFLRCVRWGVGTGMATGALVGFTVILFPGPGSGPGTGAEGFALLAAFIGAIVGTVVAVIPSVLGGLVVTGVIRRRHPQPASDKAVRRDLERMFQVLVVILDVGLVLAVLSSGEGFSPLIESLPALVAGNACVALMLCRAGAPIGEAWSQGSGAIG